MASVCPLLRLPPEVLQCILLDCGWRELVNLGATCHYLNGAVQDDLFWRRLAIIDYNVTEVKGQVNNTFKKLYQRLLHPYGWMIGLYWSRIDYFGGLLEIQLVGDSIVGNSLRVTDEGVLESSHCFEVCTSTVPATQICTRIEKKHRTKISRAKDGKSLRQKCQFHDTKFAQGHYNYNALEGFRAMTFIDAHRLGIVHQPLLLPSLSSIPRELWTTAPLLQRHTHGSSPNFFEGASSRRDLNKIMNDTIEDHNNSSTPRRPYNNKTLLKNTKEVGNAMSSDDNTRTEEQTTGTYSNSSSNHRISEKQLNTDGNQVRGSDCRRDGSNLTITLSYMDISDDNREKKITLNGSQSSRSKTISHFINRTLNNVAENENCNNAESLTKEELESNNCIDKAEASADGSGAEYVLQLATFPPMSNPRQALAQLYKETHCYPFTPEQKRKMAVSSQGLSISVGEETARTTTTTPLPPPLCVKPTQLPKHVLKPGLYAAHYGPHGYEIVLLEYKIREITLRKILGDQYVPSREVSVKICLPYSFALSWEQQRALPCSELIKMEPESSEAPLSHCHQQPFLLPPFCSPGVNTSIPSTCWARYHGFGQLANVFHSQARFSRVHIMVFSNDQFGVLFLELAEFMMFQRINREFSCQVPVSPALLNAND